MKLCVDIMKLCVDIITLSRQAMRHICSLLVSLTSSLVQGSPASWMYLQYLHEYLKYLQYLHDYLYIRNIYMSIYISRA